MKPMKCLAVSLAAVSILPSGVLAEGLERVNIDPSFMFEPGNYAEIGFGSISPSIPTSAVITSAGPPPVVVGALDNVASTFTATNMAVKTALGDRLDFGLWYSSNGNGVNIDWDPIDISADLTIPTLAGLVRYRLSDSMSIIGGLKRVTVENGSTVRLPIAVAGSGDSAYTMSSTSATTSVYGIVNEIPALAMRMVVLMEGAAALNIDTTYTEDGIAQTPGTTKASIGDATTISLQTGIAPNTLLFGSLKLSNWQDDQVHVPYNGSATLKHQVSSFGDGQSYSIGLGRKFSDQLSGSVSYFSDPASDCDSASALSPICENKSISLGAKYSLTERATLSLGTTWTQYGDAATTAPVTTTTNSSKTSYGFKLGFKF